MKDLIEGGTYIGIPAIILIVLVGLFLVMQIIGALIDFKTKAVPEFFAIWKYFKRKKDEKKKEKETVSKCLEALNEFNTHYSKDNIAKRDTWMHHIDEKEKIYDESVKILSDTNKQLVKLEKKMDELALDQNKILLHSCVDKILTLAQQIKKADGEISEEKFKHAFELHEEYERLVEKTNDPNHRVDTAWSIITDAYKKSFSK